MIKKIVDCWIRYKTKNLTRIPLFTIQLNSDMHRYIRIKLSQLKVFQCQKKLRNVLSR